MPTPPQIQFAPPPRLTGNPAMDQAAFTEYIWSFFNAAITANGLIQSGNLNAELVDQFPILYAIGTVPGAGANKMIYFTAAEAVEVTPLTDDARLLLAKDSVADMVTFLGVSTLTTEQVQDLVDALIQDGTGITWTYDDGANTLTANLNANLAIGAGTGTSLTLSGTTSLANTGAAATCGEATLVGGTKTVNTTAASATCLIFMQRKTAGGTMGNTTYTVNAGVSFTINSDNALDTSTLAWFLLETH